MDKEYIESLEKKIDELVAKVGKYENRIDILEKSMKIIEKDLYEEFEGEEDLELFCPYCSHNFYIDIANLEDEFQCPECKNPIELDWGIEETGCGGGCGSCGGGCNSQEDDDIN